MHVRDLAAEKEFDIAIKMTLEHMFQPSRFEREISRFDGNSPNFQFFVKIPICVASYFVFWCFKCVAAIANAKNTL